MITSNRTLLGCLIASVFFLSGCETKNGSVTCTFGIPGGDQRAVVANVVKTIEAGYPKFEKPSKIEESTEGKTYYTAPSCIPHITFYEITTDADVKLIEELARKGLDAAKIDKVELLFLEKQVWLGGNGGSIRGNEKVIKQILIER